MNGCLMIEHAPCLEAAGRCWEELVVMWWDDWVTWQPAEIGQQSHAMSCDGAGKQTLDVPKTLNPDFAQ